MPNSVSTPLALLLVIVQAATNLATAHDFRSSDGVRLHYTANGKGEVIVLVPGWTMPASIWTPQIEHLSQHYRVVAFDPRSQGSSAIAKSGHNVERRAQDIGEALRAVGIEGAYEGALRYVGNPDLISRTHFARYLVETGVCSETHEVFRRFLTEGKPGYVEHRWATLSDAVGWIVGAGGVAIIAHPGRYDFTPNEEYALFTEFKALGGQGVEVVTGSHTASEYVKYADMACEFDLLASRGSDFHDPGESHIDLGRLPDLPGRVTPVWEALEQRILHP